MEVPDLRAHNRRYDWRMLFMLVLMGLGSGRTNILAIAQWIEDQRDWLLVLGFGRGKTGRALPAQATLYRFFWALEKEVEALERALQAWAKDVLKVLDQDGGLKGLGLLEISLDGKHLKGSARGGVGDKAIVLVSAYLSRLGLSLLQSEAVGDEAVAGQQLMMQLEADLSEIGIPWVWTGDAAHTESQTAKAILQKGGTTSSRSRITRLS
ncbi:transposase family protein [Meiothermus hypogaeus]|nr:transposase family protein [Meiothermus hypogaeus]